MEDVQRVLKDSDRNRSVSATAMNTDSSRSHLVFILGVEVCRFTTTLHYKLATRIAAMVVQSLLTCAVYVFCLRER